MMFNFNARNTIVLSSLGSAMVLLLGFLFVCCPLLQETSKVRADNMAYKDEIESARHILSLEVNSGISMKPVSRKNIPAVLDTLVRVARENRVELGVLKPAAPPLSPESKDDVSKAGTPALKTDKPYEQRYFKAKTTASFKDLGAFVVTLNNSLPDMLVAIAVLKIKPDEGQKDLVKATER